MHRRIFLRLAAAIPLPCLLRADDATGVSGPVLGNVLDRSGHMHPLLGRPGTAYARPQSIGDFAFRASSLNGGLAVEGKFWRWQAGSAPRAIDATGSGWTGMFQAPSSSFILLSQPGRLASVSPSNEVQAIDAPGDIQHAAISDDGQRILLLDPEAILTLGPAGEMVERVLHDGARAIQFVPTSHDYVTSGRNGAHLHRSGVAPQRLSDSSHEQPSLAWAAGGSRLLVLESGRSSIDAIAVASDERVQIALDTEAGKIERLNASDAFLLHTAHPGVFWILDLRSTEARCFQVPLFEATQKEAAQ